MVQVYGWSLGALFALLAWLVRESIPPPWVELFLMLERHAFGWLLALSVIGAGVAALKIRARLEQSYGYDYRRLPGWAARVRKLALISRGFIVPWLVAWALWNWSYYEPAFVVFSESAALILAVLTLMWPEIQILPGEMVWFFTRTTPEKIKLLKSRFRLILQFHRRHNLTHHFTEVAVTKQPGTALAKTGQQAVTPFNPDNLMQHWQIWLTQTAANASNKDGPTEEDFEAKARRLAHEVFGLQLPNRDSHALQVLQPELLRRLRKLRRHAWDMVCEVINEGERQRITRAANPNLAGEWADNNLQGVYTDEGVNEMLAQNVANVFNKSRMAIQASIKFVQATLLLHYLCEVSDTSESTRRQEDDKTLAQIAQLNPDLDETVQFLLNVSPPFMSHRLTPPNNSGAAVVRAGPRLHTQTGEEEPQATGTG